ncbi:hypothetical protein DNTS_015217 [Danionella cerebrum]|uniref:Uncharacterized protein n=1 Tax=Danionella cerebrum TaxID=2873325 RepID=A0A553NJM3_9TELE|nr:hypothetical protein DNTS_015217 [Danionella translucida]
MSFSLPKSESTTSLLRSSAPVDPPGARRAQHQRTLAAAASGAQPADNDASSRRPLCHPSLAGSRNSGEKSHPPHSNAHRHTLPSAPSQEDLSDLPGEGERKAARRHHHHHHHHQHHNRHHHHHRHRSTRDDLPQESRPKHSHAARMPTRTQSFSESRDDPGQFFESPPPARPGSGSSVRKEACPASTTSSSPVPASSRRSSRRSGRISAASSEADFNLRPFLSSVFGQCSFF